MPTRQYLLQFLERNPHAVIGTVTRDNEPQAALVEFSQTDNLDLYFDTFRQSRKYANIMINNRVALTIGGEDGKTLQCQGKAIELNGEQKDAAIRHHRKKLRDVEKFEHNPEIAYFAVKLNWLRLTDVTTQPWTIFETTDLQSIE